MTGGVGALSIGAFSTKALMNGASSFGESSNGAWSVGVSSAIPPRILSLVPTSCSPLTARLTGHLTSGSVLHDSRLHCLAGNGVASAASDKTRDWRKLRMARLSSAGQLMDAGRFRRFSRNNPEPSNITELEESATSPPPDVNSADWRLFSNLNGSTLQHEPGSLSGSILLVAGTTVGAGILAIPAVTHDAGFLPSAATCVVCWLYMAGTGLLVAEVNINTMCALGTGGVSLVSMAARTLGQNGVRVACAVYLLYHYPLAIAYVARCSDIISSAIGSPFVAYLFIHYALLVAYVARSSEIITTAIGLPLWLSGCLFTVTLGGLCYFSSQRVIDLVNGILVGLIIATFALLVGVAAGGVQLESLLKGNVAAVSQSIPIIALSFVYQNVVPVICTSLEGDLPKIRTSILIGTAIPLVMFLVWDAVILGSIHLDPNNPTETFLDPLQYLQSSNGIVWPIIQAFSLLAVATSYIGFVLGLSDFISDLLKLPSGGSKHSVPYLLTLVPPLALAFISPDIFFNALDFAGTYGVMVLFGILPAAMAWSERYTDSCLRPLGPRLVPGGRLTLSVIIGFAVVVISSDLLSHGLS